MQQLNSKGAEVINSFMTPKGTQRTLEVEVYENGDTEISFTSKSNESEIYRLISLNRREALALVFYLIRLLLPNKFLANKWKKEERKEEKENNNL